MKFKNLFKCLLALMFVLPISLVFTACGEEPAETFEVKIENANNYSFMVAEYGDFVNKGEYYFIKRLEGSSNLRLTDPTSSGIVSGKTYYLFIELADITSVKINGEEIANQKVLLTHTIVQELYNDPENPNYIYNDLINQESEERNNDVTIGSEDTFIALKLEINGTTTIVLD